MNLVGRWIVTGGLLLLALPAGAQTCAPEEMTDIYVWGLDLTWMPNHPLGDTEFILWHANNGPNTNVSAHPITANLYELDDALERFRLVVTRAASEPVQPGPPYRFGQGGYNATIVQGKTYEIEVVYECDTHPDNNSLFRIAHTANPAYVVFRDGMEGAPLPPAGAGNGDRSLE